MSSPYPTTGRQEAIDFLMGRLNYEHAVTIPYQELTLKLQRMRRLLDLLGNPQRRLNIVHVAGSKGKGSTVMTIASLLTAAGQDAGTYTSPHLERVEERVSVNGQPISSDDFIGLVGQIRPAVDELDRADDLVDEFGGPTYFEILTALAMLHFDQKKVRWCVLEVGLGGRLDSTNVCQPLVTVITSISLDHMLQLGNTLGEIAREKAGILKPGIPLVNGVATGQAREVIQQIAQPLGCEIYTLGEEFHVRYRPAQSRPGELGPAQLGPAQSGNVSSQGGRFDYRDTAVEFHDLPLRLMGSHQAENAGIAIKAIRLLQRHGIEIDQHQLKDGLASVNCPARIEIISGQPPIVLDTAHNVASIKALLEVLESSFGQRRRVFVLATTRGKAVREMLRCLSDQVGVLILTQYVDNPRSHTPQDLATIVEELRSSGEFGQSMQVHLAENPDMAWQLASGTARPEDVLCVTGSFFLAAELLATLRRQACVV